MKVTCSRQYLKRNVSKEKTYNRLRNIKSSKSIPVMTDLRSDKGIKIKRQKLGVQSEKDGNIIFFSSSIKYFCYCLSF